MKIRCYYENTDAGGVVYHSNYINFCERARSELFFKNGVDIHNKNEFFVVKSLQAEYNKPAVLGDILDIKTQVVQRKATWVMVNQKIYRDEELLFEANIKVVYLKDFRPAKIPLKFVEIFEKGNLDD